jgi:microcystin-dependent protein
MSEPFLSEIRVFSFNFAPKGWAMCNGQLLQINQNQALFSLLGTTYGGDGRTTFALPNLEAAAPMHTGNGHSLGQKAGEVSHTLLLAELPAHTHLVTGSGANGSTPGPGVPAAVNNVYGPPGSLVGLLPASLSPAGGGQAHSNLMPFLTLNFCIALQGIFPSRN